MAFAFLIGDESMTTAVTRYVGDTVLRVVIRIRLVATLRRWCVSLAPLVQAAVAIIGALTLLMAGCSALVQRDIKRVLAYSTMSQVGYMFLALGVGAWSAAIFHFMTHAFFKALLFLAAGVVILSQHHEHDIFRMGDCGAGCR
jgi:NADH:ubiquinone oxidoreductase subunit 5 (subunit L)/multisubunit Na+/H+ antiporter MnhA subunit